MNGRHIVSMKSNPEKLAGRGVRRIEYEAPWSRQSLAKIRDLLRNRHAKREPHFSRRLPGDILTSMGLNVVQERIARRVAREIIRHDKQDGIPVAELDIDNVVFHGDPKIRVFEVEIEAKTPRSVKTIIEIAGVLQSTYPEFLKEWPHGKLATGIAIQRLLKSGVLQSFLGHNGLKAEAFRLIQREIGLGPLTASGGPAS